MSKEQKKIYKDKNINNRKDRNQKRNQKNLLFNNDPFLTEGDYDINKNNKNKIIENKECNKNNHEIRDNKEKIDNSVEQQNNIKEENEDNQENIEDKENIQYDDSYFEPVEYK